MLIILYANTIGLISFLIKIHKSKSDLQHLQVEQQITTSVIPESDFAYHRWKKSPKDPIAT